jgi:hypothetical protein
MMMKDFTVDGTPTRSMRPAPAQPGSTERPHKRNAPHSTPRKATTMSVAGGPAPNYLGSQPAVEHSVGKTTWGPATNKWKKKGRT